MKPSGALIVAAMAVGFFLAPYTCGAQDTEATPRARDTGESRSLRESDIPAMPGLRIEGEGEVAGSKRQPTVADGTAAPSRGPNGGLLYTVRPGDALSAIAQLYGLDTSELARANHLDDESVVRSGQVLQVPNPFAAQVRKLQTTIEQLNRDIDSARRKEQIDAAKIQSAGDQLDQLRASNQDLQRGVRLLPWWRWLGLTAGGAALLMLGVTALTMLEWLMLRRRFRGLVEMNEAIRRLDQKYKVALSKAELRLQQLYGRRRAVDENAEASKSPDQIEIERLNQQLKMVLEEQLQRLGASSQRTRRRSRLRDLLTGVEESPVEARVSRR
jgi:LysM repeat protein